MKRLIGWITETVCPLLVTWMMLLSATAIAAEHRSTELEESSTKEAATLFDLPLVGQGQEDLVPDSIPDLIPELDSSIVQITDIQLNVTPEGLTLRLQTTDELPPPTTTIVGNAAIADLDNATLNLPDRDEVSVASPVEGIALISVSPLPNNRVRIAITGTSAPPAVNLEVDSTGLQLSAIPGTETAEDATDGIQIIVTGDQAETDYFVPEASTATRTNTSILDTPASVQVIPSQILEDQQILRVDDALQNVSGVVGSLDPFGGSALTLRGFTADSFTAGPILRDGFRVYDNLGFQETANLEQIEVLRGPASVLYGQGAPGGIINLVTKQPLFEAFYDLQFQAGSFGLVRPSVDLSGPLTDDPSLRYRLNAAYQREEGFRNFDTDVERFFIAPVVSWDITDRTTLSLLVEYLDDQSPFDLGLVAIGDGVVDVPFDRITTEPDDRRHTRSLSVGYNLDHQFSDAWRLQNALRYVHQDYHVEVFLPFIIDDTTGTITRFPAERRYYSDDFSVQTSFTGNFTTGPIEHTLLAGVDLNWNRFDEAFTRVALANPSPLDIFNPTYGLVPRPNFDEVEPLVPFDTEYDRVGVFFQDQLSIGNHVILVGSLRYDSVNFRNTEEGTGQSNSAWSPRIGLIYQPLDTISLYASYAQSFTPNLVQGIDGDFLDPESAEGFEIGLKTELLSNRLLLTLAYFDITKQNVATVVDPLTGASAATGEQRSQGIELDVSGEILPGWNVIGFYAYTDARVTEDNVIPVGNRLFNAPYHSAGLWTTYQIQAGDFEGLGFGIGVNYVGDRAGDLANSFEVDDYFLTNAAIFYVRDRWRIGLNINNLFDVNYIRSVSNSRRNGIVPGSPLSIVGSISVQF
ncbi:TonB-dependent siderophore receptor [Thermocoleostomius sinensis]|uniref:TonB-dependent siderophore receptor n=1 Tax=Thermocoleostomius sinensis A174 TaxID=2016057 RepID=A0A9E8ZG50_9CYAN|nr:TonB-dependent siderophore receptor [Thermocoleostomius sinensis]WAL62181.1 TonB-dependent siderophore receptor [Thermocoleostomius sinensis A174]